MQSKNNILVILLVVLVSFLGGYFVNKFVVSENQSARVISTKDSKSLDNKVYSLTKEQAAKIWAGIQSSFSSTLPPEISGSIPSSVERPMYFCDGINGPYVTWYGTGWWYGDAQMEQICVLIFW